MNEPNRTYTHHPNGDGLQILATLYERFADRVFRLAVGMVQDEQAAEDIVQETFIKAIRKSDVFRGDSQLSTWLFRIAYNTAVDYLRKHHGKYAFMDISENDDSAPLPTQLVQWETPENEIERTEVHAVIRQAVTELPPTQRAVFYLRDIEGCSVRQTAEILDVSESVVKVRLHRARLYLRERLSQYFSLLHYEETTPQPTLSKEDKS